MTVLLEGFALGPKFLSWVHFYLCPQDNQEGMGGGREQSISFSLITRPCGTELRKDFFIHSCNGRDGDICREGTTGCRLIFQGQ